MMTARRSFDRRFDARANGSVLVLTFPADLDSRDIELITSAASVEGPVPRGFVWDLDALRGELCKLLEPGFRDWEEGSPGACFVKCWTAAVRRGAHVVFLNGAEFVRYYNERIKFGGYLEDYVTEGEAVAAVMRFMDHI